MSDAKGAASRPHIAGAVTFLVGVADDAHSRTAARFAALRAARSGGSVALVHVVEPPDFQHWAAVEDLMREETNDTAEALLASIAKEVVAITDTNPSEHIREGRIGEQILGQIDDDPSINLLVVGAAPPDAGKGSLISWLAGQLAGQLHVPLVIVPGDLTDEQLRDLT